MKRYLLLPILLATVYYSALSQGDTISVPIYDQQVMSWYEGYRTTAELPPGDQSYRAVNLHFTLGCPNSGCSDWDYTVLIKAFQNTGEVDTLIASIDTISQDPLVLDTTFDFQPVVESFELGRMITPYAGYMARNQLGFDNNWQHRYVFDVTDYALLLEDSVEFEVFYQGWSSGFTVDMEIEYITGTPPREVVDIENLYQPGGYNYIDPDDFESSHMPPKDIFLPDGASHTALHFLPSGHGFVNDLNCAEFCERKYFVKADGEQLDEVLMWRDDCGYNPIYPQAGTWLYNRANWCPGSKAIQHEHDLSSAIENDMIPDLNIDIEPYNYTVPSGETPANYNLSAILIHHSGYNFENDAAITDVLQPSDHEAHSRYNPSCGTARIELQNTGSNILESATFRYGVDEFETYQWTGTLAPMEKTVVQMPFRDPAAWNQPESQRQFSVEILNINGTDDEYADNNLLTSNYTTIEAIDRPAELEIRTNQRGDQNSWTLYDLEGNIVLEEDELSSNSILRWDWPLENGCYHFRLRDSGGNGLSFFANNDGSGDLQLRTTETPIPFTEKNFRADFGSQIDYYFLYTGGTTSSPSSVADEAELYPNPAADRLFFRPAATPVTDLEWVDLMGHTQAVQARTSDERIEIKVGHLPPGIRFLKVTTPEGTRLHKVLIAR